MRKRGVWLFAAVTVALFAAAAIVLTITAADAIRPWLEQVTELVNQLGGSAATPAAP
ncbi:MAG TPA: hypothetical protein VNQ48_02110 [Microbacteriaceae bacterium]|nr:hypothetical protein [Microbacteriaceae bacterium]